MILCLYIIAGNTQAGWLYAVIALLIGLLCANLAISYMLLSRLEFQFHHPELIPTGQTARIAVTVKNNSNFYLNHYCFEITADENFDIVEPLPEKGDQNIMLVKAFDSSEADSAPACEFIKFHIRSLAPHEERTFSYAMRAKRRGCHTIKFQTRSVNFPISIIAAAKRDSFDKPIKVYPAPINAAVRKNLNSHAENRRVVRLKSTDGDIRGLHEYSEGEDIRFIHWLTSARIGRPMIKEFQEIRGFQNILIIPIADYSLLKQLYPKIFSRWQKRSEKESIFASLLRFFFFYINFKSKKDLEESLSSHFGFEELLCCLITAAEKCRGRNDRFSVVLQNSKNKLQTLSDLKALKSKASEWSVLNSDFCLKDEEQKQRFYHSLEHMLKKRHFSRIMVLSLSQEALPVPCLKKYKNKTSYLLFSPFYLDETNSAGRLKYAGALPKRKLKREFYDAFSQKFSILQTLSKTAVLITPNSSPQDTEKLL